MWIYTRGGWYCLRILYFRLFFDNDSHEDMIKYTKILHYWFYYWFSSLFKQLGNVVWQKAFPRPLIGNFPELLCSFFYIYEGKMMLVFAHVTEMSFFGHVWINSMTTEQTQSVLKVHIVWLKSPAQRISCRIPISRVVFLFWFFSPHISCCTPLTWFLALCMLSRALRAPRLSSYWFPCSASKHTNVS